MEKNHSFFFEDFYNESPQLRLMTINNPYNFKIVNYSPSLLEALGYTPEEIAQLPSIQSLYHPDCYDILERAIILCLQQGFLRACPLILKTKKGDKVFTTLDILPTKDKQGNVLFYHCLYRDKGSNLDTIIEQEQQTLESLNKRFIESQDFYQYFYDFYENAPDMFAYIAGTGDEDINSVGITNCNNTFAEKLGYAKKEILSLSMYDLYHPDCLEEIARMRAYCMEHGEINNWELSLKKKNGEKLHVALSARSKKDANGNTLGCISLWRDISDLVETRQQLQKTNDLLVHQNEEIKSLMHLISHDIQSPIRAIYNFTQFILDESSKVLPESVIDFLNRIQTNVMRLQSLTRDLLSFFIGGETVGIEETDVASIIEQAVSYLDIPPTVKITLECKVSPFKAKKMLLSQVLCNLISNAVKYHPTPEQAEIYIKVEDDTDYWRFIVKDNGIGIAPQFHQTVFEPLTRLKIAKNVDGSGLGLAIVKKLITQEGGQISLSSQEGKGATFTFTWPK